jgi:hypothetical protein
LLDGIRERFLRLVGELIAIRISRRVRLVAAGGRLSSPTKGVSRLGAKIAMSGLRDLLALCRGVASVHVPWI